MCPAPKLRACSVGMGRAAPCLGPSRVGRLVPDLEEGVPGACGHGHPVICDPKAAHTVIVARKDTWGREKAVGVSGPPGLPQPPGAKSSPARSPFMASQMLQLKSS